MLKSNYKIGCNYISWVPTSRFEERSVLDPTKTEERTVTLGGGDGTYVEITSGLSEGDTVLVPLQAQGGGAGGMTGMAVAVS